MSSDGRLQLLLENLCLVGGKLLLSCKSESLLKPLDRTVVESTVVGDLSDKVCVPRLQKLAGCSTNFRQQWGVNVSTGKSRNVKVVRLLY